LIEIKSVVGNLGNRADCAVKVENHDELSATQLSFGKYSQTPASPPILSVFGTTVDFDDPAVRHCQL
jgi:hypothetical protein